MRPFIIMIFGAILCTILNVASAQTYIDQPLGQVYAPPGVLNAQNNRTYHPLLPQWYYTIDFTLGDWPNYTYADLAGVSIQGINDRICVGRACYWELTTVKSAVLTHTHGSQALDVNGNLCVLVKREVTGGNGPIDATRRALISPRLRAIARHP